MFDAMLRLGATPVCSRSSGTWATPARIAGRGSPGRSVAAADAAPCRRRAGACPVTASASSRWPLPATPGDAEHLAGADDQRDVAERFDATIAERGEPVDLEHDVADRPVPSRRRATATSRPTISAASDRVVAAAVSTVPIELPPRSTVTRSATAVTSWSLCEMKITVRPSAAIARSVTKSPSASCGVSTAVGSSRISTRASR